jgi:hypothetical protein
VCDRIGRRDSDARLDGVNKCSVCSSARAREVDDLIRSGRRSLRSIALAFELGEKAVQRHVNGGHVAPRSPGRARTSHATRNDAERVSASLPPSDAATGDPASTLRAQLADLDTMATEAMSVSARLQVMEERRRTLEALAKIEPLAPAQVVRIEDVDGLVEFLRDTMEALEPYIDARLAMVAVLDRHRVNVDVPA